MSVAENTLQKARILHAAFFLTSILYVLIPMVAFKTQTKEVNSAVVLAISCVAVSDIGMGFSTAASFSHRWRKPSQKIEKTRQPLENGLSVSCGLAFFARRQSCSAWYYVFWGPAGVFLGFFSSLGFCCC